LQKTVALIQNRTSMHDDEFKDPFLEEDPDEIDDLIEDEDSGWFYDDDEDEEELDYDPMDDYEE